MRAWKLGATHTKLGAIYLEFDVTETTTCAPKRPPPARRRPPPAEREKDRALILPADRLVAEGGAEEVEQAGERHQDEERLEAMRQHVAELEQAADRPTGRGARADQFRADEDGDADQGQSVGPVDGRIGRQGGLHA